MRLKGFDLTNPVFTTTPKLGAMTLLSLMLMACSPANEDAVPVAEPDTASPAEHTTPSAPLASEEHIHSQSKADNSLIVYSYRPEQVIQPLLDAFSAETGITTQLKVYPGDSLLAHYHQSPETVEADLLVLVDAMRFQILADANLLRPLPQAALEQIPEGFKAKDDLWLGLGVRARAALWKATEFAPSSPAALIPLAAQGRVCIREGQHIYNRSFLGWLIASENETLAQDWAQAIYPQRAAITGGDRAQITALLEGHCDVALVNHYYLAMLAQQDPEVLNQLTFGWQDPDQPVQTNISGIAVTQQGANAAAADQLAIWLSQPERAQQYAASVFELPVNWQTQPDAIASHVAAFSELKPSSVYPADFATQWRTASELLDAALNTTDELNTP